MKCFSLIFVFLVAVIVCHAQWQTNQWALVDDFQNRVDGEIVNAPETIGWEVFSSGEEEYWFLASPKFPDDIALYIEPGLMETIWIAKELPDGGIPPGKLGTLFFQVLFSGFDIFELKWGAMAGSLPVAAEVPNVREWIGFTALARFDNGLAVEAFDQGTFLASNPMKNPPIAGWCKFWMVVENAFEGEVSTGGYTIYMQGPDETEPVRVGFGEQQNFTTNFANAPIDPEGEPQAISRIVISTTNPYPSPRSAGDPWLIGAVYFSPGVNLEDPGLSGSEPIGQDVDTGNFLGWINIESAPLIYSYSLESWLYMEEPDASAPGGWGYIFK